MQNVKLTIDGQDVIVKDYSMEFGVEGVNPIVKVEGFLASKYDYRTTMNVNIAEPFSAEKIADMLIKDVKLRGFETMDCEKACEDRSYSGLAKRIKDLDLSEDDRLLRKYKVVYDNGEVTSTGQELLFQCLLDDYKETLVEQLKALEEAKITE